MKKSLWINLALLVAIILLGLLAWRKPASTEPAHALTALTAADAKSVEIAFAGAPAAITLGRGGAGWEITGPFPARADNFLVNRMLEVLEAKSSERYPASGLARYGLNEPAVRLKIDGREFGFGALNEMTREQYVLSGDSVYLLPVRYGAALPKSPLNLVSKQLFSADEAPVSFDFGSFNVHQNDGKWALEWTTTTLPHVDAGADDINRWVDEWRLASALSVQAPTQRKPSGALKLKLKDGSDVIVKILERGANPTITRSDQPFEYVLSAETGARLLAPPAPVPAATAAPAR